MGFLTICSDAAGQIYLALAADGTLWKAEKVSVQNPAEVSVQNPALEYVVAEKRPEAENGVDEAERAGTIAHWTPVDFNGMYAGYYPPCHFTALLATKCDFVAAGMGEDGFPVVYRSLYGGVWDQVALAGKTPMAELVQARGRVNAMLFEPVTAQIFLLCDNGELVTLPDCPKCVRIRRVADQAITAGEICGKELRLTLADGTVLETGVADVVQYRISYSYARNYLASHGGTVVWLGQGTPEFGQVTGAEDAQRRQTSSISLDDGTDGCDGAAEKKKQASSSSPDDETDECEGAAGRKKQAGSSSPDDETDECEGAVGRKIRTLRIPPDDVTDWLREGLEQGRKEEFMAFWCDYGVQADAAAAEARSMGYAMACSLGGEREFLHVV